MKEPFWLPISEHCIQLDTASNDRYLMWGTESKKGPQTETVGELVWAIQISENGHKVEARR